MPDVHEQGHPAPVAVAEEFRLVDLEVAQKGGGVVRRLLEAERAADDVSRMPISLLLKCDDLPVALQFRQKMTERSLNRVSAAVKQNKRRTRSVRSAVNLVIHSQSVHQRIALL